MTMAEAKLIEAMARRLYRDEFDCSDDTVAEHFEWYERGKHDPASCVNYSNVARMLNRASASLAAAEKAGFAIVPREPTEAMIRKALASTSHWRDIPGSALTVNMEKMRIRWRAMLAASEF